MNRQLYNTLLATAILIVFSIIMTLLLVLASYSGIKKVATSYSAVQKKGDKKIKNSSSGTSSLTDEEVGTSTATNISWEQVDDKTRIILYLMAEKANGLNWIDDGGLPAKVSQVKLAVQNGTDRAGNPVTQVYGITPVSGGTMNIYREGNHWRIPQGEEYGGTKLAATDLTGTTNGLLKNYYNTAAKQADVARYVDQIVIGDDEINQEREEMQALFHQDNDTQKEEK
jgi:hypothetical protein